METNKSYPKNMYYYLLSRKYNYNIDSDRLNKIVNNINFSPENFLDIVTAGILNCKQMKKTLIDIYKNEMDTGTAIAVHGMNFEQYDKNINKIISNLNQIFTLRNEKTNVSGISEETPIVVLGLDRSTKFALNRGGINTIGDIIDNIDTLWVLRSIGPKRLKMIRYNPKLIAMVGDNLLDCMKVSDNKYINEI